MSGHYCFTFSAILENLTVNGNFDVKIEQMQKHIWHRKLQTQGTVIGLFKIKQTYELDNKYKALSLEFKIKTKGKVNIQRFNSQIQSALTLHNNNYMTNTFVYWNTDKYIIKVCYKLVSYKKKSDLPMPFLILAS